MTVWQVQVSGVWRYSDPESAALVACNDPARVRLTDQAEPFGLRFEREPHITRRGATKNRLRASERALRKQREAVPLFSSWVAASQPSPAERIELADDSYESFQTSMRAGLAANWRRGRRLLRAAPADLQRVIRFAWNVAWCPGNGTYFVSYITDRLRQEGLYNHEQTNSAEPVPAV